MNKSLPHRMLRTMGREAVTPRFISQHYGGPVVFVDDRDCYPVVESAAAP